MSIIKPIILGILAASFSLVLELVFSTFPGMNTGSHFLSRVTPMVLLAVIIEEGFKYAIIYKSFSDFEKRKEIIASSLLVGVGFALTEITFNILWKLNPLEISPFLLGIFFVHVFTCGFSGYLLSKKENPYFTTVRTLIFNSLLHLIYNLAVLYLF